jgi:beta-phosphoglucomutase-like phosphatase (HAD superfamily)
LPNALPAIEAALDAVVFDFDGVILESVRVKDDAFRALFAGHPGEIDAIMGVHRHHGGVNRFVKFEMIYRDILRRPLDPAHKAELGRRFEELVVARVMACPMVPGALELLERLRGHVAMAVVSGTPDGELGEIIARRGLASFFDEVHGGSRDKCSIIEGMTIARQWRRERIVMAGDAMTDHEAARANGIAFVGRVPRGDDDPFPPGTITIPDLHDFAAAAIRATALSAAASPAAAS